MAESRAEVVWEGDLTHGGGRVTVGSGAFPVFPVTWASRTARAQGRTSPEELIAAAHASCFSMALSHGLAEAGTPPERLRVSAVVSLNSTDAGLRISSVALEVWGRVPGVDFLAFAKAAEDAKAGCPVSQALTGVEITVRAYLEEE
ncbi:MAG: OsmC family peroxiredoxin [Actinobacteria bacterium]|nr:OsmC family peroxiredoxin [Actinomycetota bacterium]